MRTLAAAFLLFVGCSFAPPKSAGEASSGTFVLASTTSTQDSGLLDALTREFEKEHSLRVKVVAVGSGEALDLGRRGDADVVLAHSPDGEKEFMDEGYGVYRKSVMRNDFVIVGPEDDPAAVRGETNAVEAFTQIAKREALFASRGDESGTHTRELKTWKSSGIQPGGSWYLQTGQGMAETLIVASERNAYTLTDTATFTVMATKVNLEVLVEGDQFLVNSYSVILPTKARKPDAGDAFAQWIVGPGGQSFIREFGRRRYGAPLFVPIASP